MTWPSTDETLVPPTSSGEWTEFAERYRPHMVRYCERRGLQESVAEDMIQHVFCKLVHAMQTFEYDPNKSLRGFLKTIIKQTVHDYYRDLAQRVDVGTGDTGIAELLRQHPARDRSGVDELADSFSEDWRREVLRKAMQAVRGRFRHTGNWEAFVKRANGVPAKELADRLSMSVASIDQAHSRGRRFLKEEVARQLGQKV